MRITFIIILSTIFFRLTAQQDISFSQYMYDKMLVNPAYAGSSQWIVGALKNRTYVSEIEGVPQTNIFSFQAPWQSKNIGFGVKFIQDKIAVTNRFIASGIFSYHIGFGNGRLSFGLEGGIINSHFNYDELVRTIQNDPSIPAGNQSTILPDISTGIFYRSEKFYLGASAYHLLNKKIVSPEDSDNAFYTQARNFYMTGGYMIEINRDVMLEPGFLLKYVNGVIPQMDVNLSLIFLDKFSTGISYRTGDAILAMFKVDVTKNLKIMYSYDYTLSSLTKYSKGNHEFGISYGIELLPPPAKKVIHPRYYF
ncbi:MAG: type IX secretion system membrane protein PorP/SprF [bacterium]